MYFSSVGDCHKLLKGVVKQNTRLTITINDLPNFVLIEESLESNDIPLTIVKTFSNPNLVNIKLGDR